MTRPPLQGQQPALVSSSRNESCPVADYVIHMMFFKGNGLFAMQRYDSEELPSFINLQKMDE